MELTYQERLEQKQKRSRAQAAKQAADLAAYRGAMAAADYLKAIDAARALLNKVSRNNPLRKGRLKRMLRVAQENRRIELLHKKHKKVSPLEAA